MAVINISRIQVRRGQENQTGVPVLAGGEFAWAADTEKLFIGLRREDGGSRDTNIEVLTENHLRNFFSTLSSNAAYTYYRDTDITSMDGGTSETVRTIEQKLDDSVSVADFGVVGNSLDDNTAALRIAIENLFLDPLQPVPLYPTNSSKVLKIPAGTYNISDTLFIPKNTVIIGEGVDRTIINLLSTGSHVFQTIDASSIGSVLGGDSGYVTFDNSAINSNTQPNNIYLEGMTLQYSTTTDIATALSLLSLDCAEYAIVKNIKFKGHRTVGNSTNTNYAGINIRGYQQLSADNVLIDNCEFEYLSYGIKSNYDIVNPIITNSKFNELYRGISFNDPTDAAARLGPQSSRMLLNRFTNIETEAIYAGDNGSTTVTNHISMNNSFINVGNGNSLVFGEANSTGTAIITYATPGNSSVNDFFGRDEFQRRHPDASYTFNPLINGRATIDRAEAPIVVIAAGTTKYVMRIPVTNYVQFLIIKYTATSSQPVNRTGILRVNMSEDLSPTAGITDDYSFTTVADGDITWALEVNAGAKYLQLTATNNGSNTLTIQYQSNLML
jgi:hypothetical protein